MSTQERTNPSGAWVKLHLERQSETSTMPASIIGYLSEEKPGSYVLTKTIESQEDEDTYEVTYTEVPVLMLVSRTYVWMCEILGETPLEDTSEVYSGEGGMG